MRDIREKKSIIMETITAMALPFIILFGVYVVFNGHLSPGGGFSGGTIIGAAFVLYHTVFGKKRTGRLITFSGGMKISCFALLFYALAKGYSFYTGANHLAGGFPLGSAGSIFSAGLILPLNIAVGMVVACTIYAFYYLFQEWRA